MWFHKSDGIRSLSIHAFRLHFSLPLQISRYQGKKRKSSIGLRRLVVKNAPFERGSRNKEKWYGGRGRARVSTEIVHKRIIQPEFTFYMRASTMLLEHVRLSNDRSTPSYFCVRGRFGRLSEFDRNCYRLFSTVRRRDAAMRAYSVGACLLQRFFVLRGRTTCSIFGHSLPTMNYAIVVLV